MGSFKYRKATLEDTGLIIEIIKFIDRETWPWKENMIEFFAEHWKESVPRLLSENTEVIFLVYDGAQFAGMGTIYIWPDDVAKGEATLSRNFYTMPEYRGQKVMHNIMELLIEEARKRGCRNVITDTDHGKYREELHKMGFRDIYDDIEDYEYYIAVMGPEDPGTPKGLSNNVELLL